MDFIKHLWTKLNGTCTLDTKKSNIIKSDEIHKINRKINETMAHNGILQSQSYSKCYNPECNTEDNLIWCDGVYGYYCLSCIVLCSRCMESAVIICARCNNTTCCFEDCFKCGTIVCKDCEFCPKCNMYT